MIVPRWRPTLAVGLFLIALHAQGGAVPARASTPASAASGSTAAALVGPFGVGDSIEAMVDPRTGSFALESPIPGGRLRWGSRASTADRFGLGPGWTLADVPLLELRGGVRVVLGDGRVGELDTSAPSGLHGLGDEVAFRRAPGVLPARSDGAAGERRFEYTLAEPGLRTYFSASGDPVAAVGAAGERADWVWADEHLLVEQVSESAVVTRWERTRGRVVLSSHIGEANASPPASASPTTVIELERGRVAGIVDPNGGRIAVGSTADGLLDRVESVSGAVTRPDWQVGADGAIAIRRVLVSDLDDGRELLRREWSSDDASAAWARRWAEPADAAWAGGWASTVVTDGSTHVETEYAEGRLTRQAVVVRTEAGATTVREQELDYPARSDAGTSVVDVPDAPLPTVSIERFAGGSRSRSATTRFAYDPLGRVVERVDADGSIVETVYDETLAPGADVPTGHPLVERRTTPDGLVEETRHTLDPRRVAPIVTETFSGRAGGELHRTSRTERTLDDAAAAVERREFPQGGDGTPIVTRLDRRTDRDAGVIVTTETAAVGTTSEAAVAQTVDLVSGAVIARTDEFGRIEREQHDAGGRPTARIDPAGRVVKVAYLTRQADGRNAVVETSPSGVARTVEHDALGRPVRRTDNIDDGAPRPGHTRIAEMRAYPDPNTEVVTDAWGAATTIRRDVLGRVVAIAQPGGVIEVHRYDDVARTVTTGITPDGELAHAEATTTRRFDDRERVVGETDWRADGGPVRAVERAVDGFGRELRLDDGVATVATAYDSFGNPVQTTRTGDPTVAPVTAHREFDGFGRAIEKTLAQDDEVRTGGRRALDARGRTVAETDQAGRTTTYALAPDGQVDRETTAYGQVTANTYDPVTRQLVETVTTSPIGDAVHLGFAYDPHTGALRSTFDPRERAATEIVRTYDALGGLTGVHYPDGQRIQHRYDEHGRRLATIDVAGAETHFAYDAAGRLDVVERRAADGTVLARVSYTRDRLGRLARIDRGNGAATVIDSTSLGQVAGERTSGPDGEVLSARTYRYDASGNVVERTDRARPASGGEVVERRTEYRYDAEHRLRESIVRDPDSPADAGDARVVQHTRYTLSVSGDVTREVVSCGLGVADERTTVREFEYRPTGELVAVTHDGRRAEQGFDEAGNLVRDIRGATYRYDARNRAVAETTAAGETTRTTYWADGQRAGLATGDDETRFYWDDDTLLNDVHVQGGVRRVAGYLLGDRRHARTIGGDGAETTYLVQDRHGSTTELLDAAGAVAVSYSYTDYGVAAMDEAAAMPNVASREPRVGDVRRNPFLWAGEHTDASGAQHLSARRYLPTEFRFATRDTAAFHNRYAFGDGNPVMRVDPTGHASMPDWSEVMNESWFKIMTTALAVALTVVGFLGITPLPPQAVGLLKYVIGHYGGIGGSVVQAIGTAILAVDAIDSVLESKFLTPEAGGIVRITGTVLTLAGGVVSGVFKLLRKAGNDDFQLLLDQNDLKLADLRAQVGNWEKIYAATRGAVQGADLAPPVANVPRAGDHLRAAAAITGLSTAY